MFPEKSLLANQFLLPLRLVISNQTVLSDKDVDSDYGSTLLPKGKFLKKVKNGIFYDVFCRY